MAMKKAFPENIGLTISNVLHLSPREAYSLCEEGAIIVDVREAYMGRYKMFDVDDLIFCPKSNLEETHTDLPRNKALIFADAVGLRSKEAVIVLQQKGFRNIANLTGGMVQWERDGLPLIINNSQRLTGSCMCILRRSPKK